MSTQARLSSFDSTTSGTDPSDNFNSLLGKLSNVEPNILTTDQVLHSDDLALQTTVKSSAVLSQLPNSNQNYQPKLLAEWSGYVTEYSDKEKFFAAVLKGVKGEGVKDEEEEAIIPITDVSKSDMALLSPGNFFRLCVMYEVNKSGQPRRYTQLVFRRLPAYRDQDIKEAVDRGRELARSLRVE